ncbi:uncharacterized protein DSM5745_07402 [Aspergillus mulundensis]|uniref:Uncharacterized protein n=1 Tax=Aspergillus mulundensis TaxID=1810919 RepID=A0A3D8RLA9_9EURO|nr:Uncharacterized protein DSM5745_07402 [Aspergillus mulundensis]RDW74740.1 Uncharacterized protein DSM5745_07402 [Aspergillus mulundensis]
MSFGLHLLAQGTAKSNATVLNILQLHVDEMDGFVSRTTEDFLIIQLDLRTRIQYLSLPLENLDDFDEMLADRGFRFAMIDYNGKIELAVERFTLAISDALRDLHKGREAVGALWQYLGQSTQESASLSSSLTAIYNSMFANTEGWNSALSKLRRTGLALQYAMTQLSRAVTEIQRRVGIASRKEVSFGLKSFSRTGSFRRLFDLRPSVSMTNMGKQLPCDPTSAKSSSCPRTSAGSAGRLAHQKSVPNLRAATAIAQNGKVPDRAKSLNGASSGGSDSGSILPKFSKSISRRLSKAKPTMNPTAYGEMPIRPSTSASRTLKSFRQNRYHHQPHQKQQDPVPEALPPGRVNRPSTSNALMKRETMRDQLLQYFKSDRVLDDWESIKGGGKKVVQPKTKKVGLWSMFQARPLDMRSGDLATGSFDVQRQLAWLDEETKNLNTYSLKHRPGTAPRFHTISEYLSFYQQGLDHQEHQHEGGDYPVVLEDDESIITALPAFPLPPIGHRIPEPSAEAHAC